MGEGNMKKTMMMIGLLFVAGLALAGGPDMPEQTTAIFGNKASGAPWWIVLAIALTPTAAALFLTITTTFFFRIVNRDVLKRKTLDALTLIKITIYAGLLWGPLCQWGLQRITADLTGLRVYWELIVMAPFVTGPFSLGFYMFVLMPVLRKRVPGLYETLKVRHRKSQGDADDSRPGDATITEFVGNDDDTTEKNS